MKRALLALALLVGCAKETAPAPRAEKRAPRTPTEICAHLVGTDVFKSCKPGKTDEAVTDMATGMITYAGEDLYRVHIYAFVSREEQEKFYEDIRDYYYRYHGGTLEKLGWKVYYDSSHRVMATAIPVVAPHGKAADKLEKVRSAVENAQ